MVNKGIEPIFGTDGNRWSKSSAIKKEYFSILISNCVAVEKNKAMKFDLSFTNKEITPWEMVFLKQMLDKIGF